MHLLFLGKNERMLCDQIARPKHRQLTDVFPYLLRPLPVSWLLSDESEEPENDWSKVITNRGGPNFNPDRGVPQAFTLPPKLLRILAKQKNTLQN